ncbi:hypothetical protein CTAYLR_009840 [Chrysophaeum taylorii]|uniref:Uncharacterized protein n=1 Tax=Chrysophaeum taylorii TaxID=2483200 RepID=A0AAD7XI16_9STRA|nr:hypothetical protein CTAYLR_009840 [Chrysophaeum taylorii]
MAEVSGLCEWLYSGTEAVFASCASRARDTMEGGLATGKKRRRTPDETEAMVRIGCQRLVSSLQFMFDNEFDKVELYVMRNILQFPDGVSDEFKRIVEDPPLERSTLDVNEALLDAELDGLVDDLRRAIDDNEALRFRHRVATAHADGLADLLADQPDLVAKAQAAARNFPDWRRDLDDLQRRARQLAARCTAEAPDDPPAAGTTED